MSTQTALNSYMAGRHQRANTGAARIVAEAWAEADKIISQGRAKAYQMVLEAGQEEAQIITELQETIAGLKAEQKSLHRQNANIKSSSKRVENNMVAKAERKAAQIVAKAETQLHKVAEAIDSRDMEQLLMEAKRVLLHAEREANLIRERARTEGLALADAEKLTVSIPDREAARARLQAVTNEATGRGRLKDAS